MGKFLKKLKFQKSKVGFKSDKQKIILTFSWMFSFTYRGPYKKKQKKKKRKCQYLVLLILQWDNTLPFQVISSVTWILAVLVLIK